MTPVILVVRVHAGDPPPLTIGYVEGPRRDKSVHWEIHVRPGPRAGDIVARYIASLWARGLDVRIYPAAVNMIHRLDVPEARDDQR